MKITITYHIFGCDEEYKQLLLFIHKEWDLSVLPDDLDRFYAKFNDGIIEKIEIEKV